MSDDPSILEFLFAGPLFSIFKGLNLIRKDIMGLKETIDGYTQSVTDFSSRVSAAAAEFKTELQNLQDKLNQAGTVDPAVQASVDALGQKVGDLGSAVTTLEGTEVPTVVADPSDPGTVTTDPSQPPVTPPTDDGSGSAPSDPGTPVLDPSDPQDAPDAVGTPTDTV